MASCFTVVRGKRIRVTRLDECGNPPAPDEPNAVVVTKGFVTVSLTSNVSEGDDIEQKNADGDLCVNDRSRDQLKRWDLEIELCNVDPSLLELTSNAVPELDYDDEVVGVRVPEGSSTGAFALELWTGVPGTECTPGQPAQYGYFLLPFVIPNTIGDITVENGASTFTVSGWTKAGGAWGTGPYDVVPEDADNTPGPLDEPIGPADHLLTRLTTIAPPDPECGAQDMPA